MKPSGGWRRESRKKFRAPSGSAASEISFPQELVSFLERSAGRPAASQPAASESITVCLQRSESKGSAGKLNREHKHHLNCLFSACSSGGGGIGGSIRLAGGNGASFREKWPPLQQQTSHHNQSAAGCRFNFRNYQPHLHCSGLDCSIHPLIHTSI